MTADAGYTFFTEMGTVLIVDDEPQLRKLLAKAAALEGHEALQAESCGAARAQIARVQPDVVLCDVRLGDGDGVEFVKEVRRLIPESEVILMTAYGNIPDGVQAMKNGAFDYITKGDDNDRIMPLLARAVERVRARKSAGPSAGKSDAFDGVAGSSPQMREAVSLARKVCVTDAPVLLEGETGTGKEVFANAIHMGSRRKSMPFIAVNCSAFGRDLLESELFGYRAGAFTGATKNKKGILEEADGGTVFLDEIGEMPVELQAKLLRVLESGEFIKIGDTKPSKADIRIISATNRSLPAEIDAGRFRRDLFFRLSVFQIRLPSLSERPSDIPEYAWHFIRAFSEKLGKRIDSADPRYMAVLSGRAWPGNVRELRNAVERSIIMSDGGVLRAESLPLDFLKDAEAGAARAEGACVTDLPLSEIEKRHIKKMLEFTGGNKTDAAKRLGIGVATLYRKIAEYGL